MRVAIEGQSVRVECEDLLQGRLEASRVLMRQAIDEIQADRMKARLARRADDGFGLRIALPAVDGSLHPWIKILHADTEAIEPDVMEGMDAGRI